MTLHSICCGFADSLAAMAGANDPVIIKPTAMAIGEIRTGNSFDAFPEIVSPSNGKRAVCLLSRRPAPQGRRTFSR